MRGRKSPRWVSLALHHHRDVAATNGCVYDNKLFSSIINVKPINYSSSTCNYGARSYTTSQRRLSIRVEVARCCTVDSYFKFMSLRIHVSHQRVITINIMGPPFMGHRNKKSDEHARQNKNQWNFLDEPMRPCDGATAHIQLKGIILENQKP